MLKSIRGFKSLTFRQSKPKSNTKVFGLGFSFAKIQVLSAFFGCRRAVVSVFSVFVQGVRISLSVAVADAFMPRKVLDVRKECVRLSCQRQTKSPSGCRLAVYLPTDTLLRGSRQEHRGINRLRMYQIRITSLKSLNPQYFLFCITYGILTFLS